MRSKIGQLVRAFLSGAERGELAPTAAVPRGEFKNVVRRLAKCCGNTNTEVSGGYRTFAELDRRAHLFWLGPAPKPRPRSRSRLPAV